MAANPGRTLKRIALREVRLGMHLHSLDGRWLDHPFWKTRFVLSDPADLQQLRSSRVPAVWIDTALGVDVAAVDERPALPPAIQPASQPASQQITGARMATLGEAIRAPSTREPRTARSTMADELPKASRLCSRSREAVTSLFAEARLGRALQAERCLPLVDEIADSVFRNPGALVSLARLKSADDYTYMHSVAVCALMVALGNQLGLDDADCRAAGMAGLLHDLGKAAIPPEILNKPGRLTDAEMAIVRGHPLRGHEMLQEANGAGEAAIDVCLHHHERADGRGYPFQLAGEALTTLARMGAVCDVYDAITSNRPYKAGWDPAESIAQMASWQGQFDSEIFCAFVRGLGIYPNGALVRLHSGRLAVVIEQNPAALTSPRVKAFYDTRSEMPIMPAVIDLARNTSERIVDREPPGRWNFPHLDTLWAGEAAPRRG